MNEKTDNGLSTGEGGRYRSASSTSRRPPSQGMGLVGTAVLAIVVAGLAGAGWFIANQQQMLLAEQARSAEADGRISYLEERLSATDTALSQEGQDTKQQINLWESEIRKLWAIANERNRDWIKENQVSLKKVSGALNGIEASNRDLKAATSRHEVALEAQQQLIDQVTSLDLQIQQMLRAQRNLVDNVNSASQTLSRLNVTLGSKVEEHSEAIASFDAYRLAANKRMVDLERELAGLRAAQRPPAVAPVSGNLIPQ